MPDDTREHDDQAAAGRLISLAEAADVCGLSPDHLRKLVRGGKLWGAKIGRNWVTSEAAVTAYLATDRRPGPKHKTSAKEDLLD